MDESVGVAALSAGDAGPVPQDKPVGVYLIAIFFTIEWLFFLGSLFYTLFHVFSAEMRTQYLTSVAVAPLAISEVNGLLTVVGAWLLAAMRKAGVGLLLASTILLFALIAMSWPMLFINYTRLHNPALLRSLLLGGSNLVLHIAATVYAFRLKSRGLLR